MQNIPETKADLIIHPVRLRILQSLIEGPKTTQEIASELTSVPKSSLYRHLKLLLNERFVEVQDVRLVQGIQEKVYALAQTPRLSSGDLAQATANDHFRYFTIYVTTLLQGFSDYLTANSELDFEADRVGYNEVMFWATPKEFDLFAQSLNQALIPLLAHSSGQQSFEGGQPMEKI